MFMNNRSPEKNEKGGFGERPKIANEIYELCGILLEQQRDVDDSCPKNFSEMLFSAPLDQHKCPKPKIQNGSCLEKDDHSVKTYSFTTIPFEKKKHTNSPISLHSEPLIQNTLSEVKISHASLPIESMMYKSGITQRHKEFVRPTFNEPINDKSSVVTMESKKKTMTASRNEFDKQIRDNLINIRDRDPNDIISYNNLNMMYDPVLKNNRFSSESSLHSEDTFPASEIPTKIQGAISTYSKNIDGWNKLFQGSRFYTEQQSLFPFNSLEIQKDNNNFRKTIIRKADQLVKQYDGLKSNPEKVLNSKELNNKLVSFNFALQLENKRRLGSYDINKASRKSSAPSNAGFISEVERNCFIVQTNWIGRKCKSEVQILQKTASTSGIKFLENNNCKELNFDSDSDILLKSTTSEDSSNLKGIPTLRGRKLPAKLSTLLLNSPILLNYTEGISGKSQEILMFTSDTMLEITRTEINVQNPNIVKRLLAKSRPYIGKPIHIIFEPRKATETLSLDYVGGPISLHQSPGKYNLLAETSSGDDLGGKSPLPLHLSPGKCNLLDETDPGKISNDWKNNSNVTLVAQQSDQLKGIENRMLTNDSAVLDSNAHQNDRFETSDSFEAKMKLKIRLCRRKKSRTDLKRLDVKQIVGSVFRKFFHFYSLVGGHLRSGSVITKSNSILWLKEAGVATDVQSLEVANELFKDIAGAKVVLNIFDFMQFLIQFARRQRMATVDVIGQLTLSEVPKDKKNSETRRLKTFRQSKSSNQGSLMAETNSISRSQSLPNLKSTPPMFDS